MTRITQKTAFRQTAMPFRDGAETRLILVALEPTCLVMRLKGRRTEFRVPLRAALERAMAESAEAAFARKRRRRIPRGTLC